MLLSLHPYTRDLPYRGNPDILYFHGTGFLAKYTGFTDCSNVNCPKSYDNLWLFGSSVCCKGKEYLVVEAQQASLANPKIRSEPHALMYENQILTSQFSCGEEVSIQQFSLQEYQTALSGARELVSEEGFALTQTTFWDFLNVCCKPPVGGCPRGTLWDQELCQCIPCRPPDEGCPTGSSWDQQTCSCIPTEPGDVFFGILPPDSLPIYMHQPQLRNYSNGELVSEEIADGLGVINTMITYDPIGGLNFVTRPNLRFGSGWPSTTIVRRFTIGSSFSDRPYQFDLILQIEGVDFLNLYSEALTSDGTFAQSYGDFEIIDSTGRRLGGISAPNIIPTTGPDPLCRYVSTRYSLAIPVQLGPIGLGLELVGINAEPVCSYNLGDAIYKAFNRLGSNIGLFSVKLVPTQEACPC